MRVILLLTLVGCAGPETGAPGIEVLNAWARPRAMDVGAGGSLPGANSAVYLEIRNRGPAPDRLLGGETPVAVGVEIHESVLEGDIMRMRRVEGVDLPGEAVVELRPGGLHIMLLDLREPLLEGDTLSLTLTFQEAPPVSIRVPVQGGVGS